MEYGFILIMDLFQILLLVICIFLGSKTSKSYKKLKKALETEEKEKDLNRIFFLKETMKSQLLQESDSTTIQSYTQEYITNAFNLKYVAVILFIYIIVTTLFT